MTSLGLMHVGEKVLKESNFIQHILFKYFNLFHLEDLAGSTLIIQAEISEVNELKCSEFT